MAYSDSGRRATNKYRSEKKDTISFDVPKGQKEKIKAHADAHAESMTKFIRRAIQETMERDDIEAPSQSKLQ